MEKEAREHHAIFLTARRAVLGMTVVVVGVVVGVGDVLVFVRLYFHKPR